MGYAACGMATEHLAGFRGRTGERNVLDEMLENVRSGQSAVLVIRGEAGVGKTALLRHAARQAAGFRVAPIGGVEAEMELPFAGLHQLCAPMLAHLGAIPPPQQAAMRVALGLAAGPAPDRFLVALAALSLLCEVAEEGPLLCIVDDAQWLDGASGEVLGFVARRLLAESVGIVFAVREPSSERALVGLPELVAPRPAGRRRARTARRRSSRGGSTRACATGSSSETRGNPLALLELPRGMSAADLAGGFALPDAGALPAHIEEQYVRRLGALPAATQRLMLLAAADPVGDATLVWRAAQALGIEREAAAPAATDHAARDRVARALPPSARAVGGLSQLGGARPAGRPRRARRGDRPRGRSRPAGVAPRARGRRPRRGGGRRARSTAPAARSGAAASLPRPRSWSGRWR